MLNVILLLPDPKPVYTWLSSARVFVCQALPFLLTYIQVSKGKDRRAAATMLPPWEQGVRDAQEDQQYLICVRKRDSQLQPNTLHESKAPALLSVRQKVLCLKFFAALPCPLEQWHTACMQRMTLNAQALTLKCYPDPPLPLQPLYCTFYSDALHLLPFPLTVHPPSHFYILYLLYPSYAVCRYVWLTFGPHQQHPSLDATAAAWTKHLGLKTKKLFVSKSGQIIWVEEKGNFPLSHQSTDDPLIPAGV